MTFRYHYVYVLVAENPRDERTHYIGMRSCDVRPDDDHSYMGSSRHVHAEREAGVLFAKIIISTHQTRRNAARREMKLHSVYNVGGNLFFFNRRNASGVNATTGRERVWTLEACKTDAAKYGSRKKWRQHSNGAYQVAGKRGWLAECCAHMQYMRGARRVWTYARCQCSARRYKTRADWERGDFRTYSAAKDSGWIPKLCAHMVYAKLPNGFWTLTRCKQEARAFKTRTAWQRGHRASYKAAHREGWLDECCVHMHYAQLPNGTWNEENCLRVALQYETVTEWRKANDASYTAARRKGFLATCCVHMIDGRKR